MEEMKELFYRDPYCRTFEAQVLSCAKGKHGWDVVLDDTAFYPEGGGQPADHGTLGGAAVQDVHRRDGVIVHETDRSLPVGETVQGAIDWTRRFDHMQQHSGEHIVSGLIHRKFGWDNVGFHLGETVVIDFNGPLTWEDALAVEAEANAVIYENRETVITCPSKEELAALPYRSKKELTGTVRIVEFPGADLCACCGTHVARTGEIGAVKILSLMHHRGGVRLEMLCGRRAMARLDAVYDDDSAAARSLSVPAGETAAAVEKEKGELAALKQRLGAVQQKYFRLLAAQLPQEGLAVAVEQDLSPWELRKGAEALAESGKAAAYLLLAGEGETRDYILISASQDVRPLGRALNERLHGRGGGRDAVQGRFCAPEEEILRTAAELAPQYLRKDQP